MSSIELSDALDDLGFRALSDDLDNLLSRAAAEALSHADFLTRIVEMEREDRARRSLERRHARSKIGAFKPMSEYDWNWPDDIERELVERALKMRFVEEGANLVIVGAHGVGKTMLLKNLAHQAVLSGHSVLFVTAAKMLGELSAIDSPSKLERRLKHYSGVRFLCVDEVGYLSYDSRAADLLFEIVTRRYESAKSMALTTNLVFADWDTVFPHATCTIALVDRLTHRADILKIEGSSWRRKESQEWRQREEES